MMTLQNRTLILFVLIAVLFGVTDAISSVTVKAQSRSLVTAWSSDSKLFAFSVDNGVLVVGEERILSKCAVEGIIYALGFAPDNTTVYVGTLTGDLVVCDAITGRKPAVPQTAIPEETAVLSFKFNRDGSRILVASGTQEPDPIYVYDANLTLLRQYNPRGISVPAPVIMTDGTLLTFSEKPSPVPILIVEHDGQPVAEVTLTSFPYSVQATPNGHYLLAMSNGIGLEVYDLRTGAKVSTFETASVIWNISGDSIVFSTPTDIVAVHLATGKQFEFDTETPYQPSLIDWGNPSAALIHIEETNTMGLMMFDTGALISLDFDARSYSSVSLVIDENLLIFGFSSNSIDILAYDLTPNETLSPQTSSSSLPYKNVVSIIPRAGHAFVNFQGELKVFEINTGKILYEQALAFGTSSIPRPDGLAVALLTQQSLTIQPLDGPAQTITFNN